MVEVSNIVFTTMFYFLILQGIPTHLLVVGDIEGIKKREKAKL